MENENKPERINPIISEINDRANRELYDSWAKHRPHWTDACYEAFCAGMLEEKTK